MRDLANQSYSGSRPFRNNVKNTLIRFGVVLVVGGIAVYFIGGRLLNFASSSVSGDVILHEAPRGLEAVDVDSSDVVATEGVDLESDTATFTLVRSGYVGNVKATRSYGDGKFILNVDGKLEDPEGHKYGVWLINGSERVIVGYMSGKTDFRLRERRDDEDLLAYDEIWITLERAQDTEPEDHIFEGTF